ncbi:hypothetical protein NM688_g783 [Phlebia brevispora]|uniref:Uncharacterized protein n=1 Tax=Phlebia brevispora TaxID=194682 RepID=A0ACC1TD53_9APHY|nr:hypothetical protein NM688_g783 [Phlebia brevispora]
MSDSDFEAEREANIARNRALIAQLDISLDIPKKRPREKNPKPVQPSKRVKRESTPVVPLRQSSRLRRTVADPNESPAKRRKREQEEEALRQKLEQERLEEEERQREAKKPRHQDLDMKTLMDDMDVSEAATLTSALGPAEERDQEEYAGDHEAFAYEDKEEKAAISDLKHRLQKMKIVARAKVTQDRVYCAAYHSDITKDLIFFGDKHGQLGIWDARAAPDEEDDENAGSSDTKENGKYWRLQLHWPATAKSSISEIKFDPTNSHRLYTSAYDCTIRSLDFTSGVSREEYFMEDTLICSIDLPPSGNEMWISDAGGGLTHLDLREDKSKARWYQLSDQKIGSVSINPVDPNFVLTASNSRVLKVWDVRKLAKIAVPHDKHAKHVGPIEITGEDVEAYLGTMQGKSCVRGEWRHDKSVSSAYWDPHGRRIVSTSYDDTIRLWDINPDFLQHDKPFPTFRPVAHLRHNCQTGKWLTILKARWSPNTEVYPHFTIGNMQHSLDIFSCKGDLLARLSDKNLVTAVQAVTCSHPKIVERAASGNASGRCILWAPEDT